MATLRDLSKRLRTLSKEIPKQVNQLKVDVALTIQADLAKETPVDTTKAVSNWKATRIAPFPNDVEPYFPGFYGYTAYKSIQASIADAEVNLKGTKPGETVFIVNNADYIKDLNEGSSKQAPAGFVEASIVKGRKLITDFKFKF
ncbi:minor tail protein [Erwinia phage AH03]|uniref:Minor tail protein n=1 Tax=Erwinia phage AH03 TaxID=2869568 RepID=A0AAE7X0A9_9CAUD|nr:minor tail protein [Erwinia phage AH03]